MSSSRGRLVALVLVVAATAAAGWLQRDRIQALWSGEEPAARAGIPPGPEAGGPSGAANPGAADPGASPADEAAPGARRPDDRSRAGREDRVDRSRRESRRPAADPVRRLRRFLAGAGPGSIRLDSADLAMLLGPGRTLPLAPGVSDPRAVPRDSVVEASADVDLRRALGDRLPAMVRRMVGDSARVRAVLSPTVPGPGRLQIRVRDVRAGSMAFPQAMVPWLLGQLKLPTAADDGSTVELRADPALAAVRVEDGALVLVREPGG